MSNEKYVLKYRDGRYVRRDDSTGPMSTGGYPYPVEYLETATFFDSPEEAASYAETSGWSDKERAVYPIVFSVGEPVAIYEEKWSSCNHHCIKTSESTSPDARHFLDCPVWNFVR